VCPGEGVGPLAGAYESPFPTPLSPVYRTAASASSINGEEAAQPFSRQGSRPNSSGERSRCRHGGELSIVMGTGGETVAALMHCSIARKSRPPANPALAILQQRQVLLLLLGEVQAENGVEPIEDTPEVSQVIGRERSYRTFCRR